ncbi:DUF6090 family protein [Maribacter sp. CXY002]|uniref:DUF6090 family protein n=1 Tax=Maribacter luteocoastalis TaxID=3407671 RepID=UPI003B678A87
MIKLFRNIRKSLLLEGKTTKYFRYALGEIVLVVIGILIALQINNWNEDRKNKHAENQIISELNTEFKINEEIIKQTIITIEKSEASCKKIMSLLEDDHVDLSTYNIDSLLYFTIEYKPFNPSNNSLFEVLQTGNLKIISSKKLKEQLFAWNRELENNKSTFIVYEKWIEEPMLPYYSDNIALKNVDAYGVLNWSKTSKFEDDYSKLFQERKFENIIDNNLYHLSALKNQYEGLQKIIENVITYTD